MRKIALPVTMMLGLFIIATPAHAQATRTWVSGVGDDANPCSRTAPCKTFAGAISKTATGGEINCLDPGGFGGVTFTKSLTIDCTGTLGSILAAGGINGVNVNGANIIVTLRNILINGAFSGAIGVNFVNGNSLILDNVTIENFSGGSATGIKFSPSTANAFLAVTNSTLSTNGLAPSSGQAILIQPAVGGTNAKVDITNSRLVNNINGVAAISTNGNIFMTIQNTTISNSRSIGVVTAGAQAMSVMIDQSNISNNTVQGINGGGSATVRIGGTVITGNGTGVSGTTLRSYKNNLINGNTADGTPIQQENFN
jgi:hypothetical protein